MAKTKLNKDIYVYLYYILLLALYLSWNNFNAYPGQIIRLSYLGATLVPVLLWKKGWLAAVMILFHTLAFNSYTSSYLPTQNYTYIAAIIAVLPFIRPKNRIKIPLSLLLILLIPFMLNVFQSSSVEYISSAVFMIVLLMLGIEKNDNNSWSMVSLCFVVICLVLCISYLLYGRNFSVMISDFGDERVGFADVNYVSSVIGFGVMAALVSMIYESRTIVFKIALVIMVIIAVISMLFNASRGALLALGVGTIVLIFFSNVSVKTKILISILIIGGLIVLYNNNYMDFLLYRIETDETSGGTGRVEIWKDKWTTFWSSSSILNILFGYGYIGGRRLGTIWGDFAFHNDFLAFLVEYGIVGLIILLSFLFTPLIKSNKKNRPIVLASLAYLITVELTLEPLAAGRLPFYAIWLYAYLASNMIFKELTIKKHEKETIVRFPLI